MNGQSISNEQGVLSVYVSKAKDLPNLVKLDKQDVTLRLRIAHMTRESDILKRAGQTPIFNLLEKFEMTPDIQPIMYVELYCERKKKAPLPIGRCEIDLLNGMRADPKEGYCTWYELKRDNNEFAGTIFIELTYIPRIPRLNRGLDKDSTKRIDAAMVARPIPPLPHEQRYAQVFRQDDVQSPYSASNSQYSRSRSRSPERYLHASNMRQSTPSMFGNSKGTHFSAVNAYSESETFSSSERSNGSFVNNSTPNFASSVDTNTSVGTQESTGSTSTSTTDTRFHFANLRKLKEKINVFKNPLPNVDSSNDSKDPLVDIEALQKAIGVTSLKTESSDEELGAQLNSYSQNIDEGSISPTGHTRVSTQGSTRIYSKHPIEPVLSQIPDIPADNRSSTERRTPTYNTYEQFTASTNSVLPPLPDLRQGNRSRSGSPTKEYSPVIPHLPTSPSPKRHSQSPTRRPPPPNF